MGTGYVAVLPWAGLHTFVGYPGSMIDHRDGFGFTPTEASALWASVSPGGDVDLAWNTTVGADHYCVRRASTRDGFHTGALLPLGCTPAGDPSVVTFTDPSAAAVPGERYYMVAPVNASGQ